MKKLFTLALFASMVFSLTACAGDIFGSQRLTENFIEESLRNAGFEDYAFAANRTGRTDVLAAISAPEGNYTIAAIEITEIREGAYDNTSLATAQMQLVNNYLQVVVEIEAIYWRADSEWILTDYDIVSAIFIPLAAISEDKIATRVSDYLSLQWMGPNNPGMELSDLYAGVTVFPVSTELSRGDSGYYLTTAVISLSNETPFFSVGGDMFVTYTFDAESASWLIKSSDDMEMGDSAIFPDFSKVEGTWSGTFVSSSVNIIGGSQRCLGGEGINPQMTIQSVDLQNRTLTGTLSGLSHNHSFIDRRTGTVSSFEGDIEFPATQFIADIHVGPSSITFNNVAVISDSNRFGNVSFSGSMEFVDGSVQGAISSSRSIFPERGFHDTYDFQKVD